MNTYSSLITEMRDKGYRDAYVASQIKIGLPFQAKALRISRGLTQEKLAALAGMSQPRIAEIEKPGKRKFNLETLLRIASAFDVGLEVRFVPLSDVIDHNERFDPDTFSLPTFEEELADAEREEHASKTDRLRQEIIAAWTRQFSVVPPGTENTGGSLSMRPQSPAQRTLFGGLELVVSNQRNKIVPPALIPAPQQVGGFEWVKHG